MMKFSRSYDRSILIYREESARGRILLRLGRTFEDGECKPDNPKTIPDGFRLLTYIISKDPEALIDDIAIRFSDYLDGETELTFRSVMFDALKLQERLQHEHAAAGSELIRSLDVLYGKQVIEILFAATFGLDGRKAGTPSGQGARQTEPSELRITRIGLAAFVAIVVIPIAAISVFRPSIFEPVHRRAAGESVIIRYASRGEEALASKVSIPDANARLLTAVHDRKQTLFLSTELGALNADQEYNREIETGPSADPAETAGALSPEIAKDAAPAAGVPDRIAQLSLKAVSTFNAGDPGNDMPGKGYTATYDLASRPATIFDVATDDLAGLGPALDAAVVAICQDLVGSRSDDVPVMTANLRLELGTSPFLAVAITADNCTQGSYSAFPMFDLQPAVE